MNNNTSKDKMRSAYARANNKKKAQLGVLASTASNRLRKMILFDLVQKAGRDVCYRCGKKITDIDDLTVDHKIAWMDSDDPRGLFFDLDNISFSHHSCNSRAARKHIKRDDFVPANRTHIIDDGEALQIYIRAISGEPRKQIADDYGISEYLVTDIKRVRSFVNATMEYRKEARDKATP